MSRVSRRWVAFAIVFLGLILLNYPLLSSFINDAFSVHGQAVYEEEVASLSDEERLAKLDAMRSYNNCLAVGGEVPKSELLSEIVSPGYLLGYLDVPSINVYMAVRYGTTADVLEKDLGLLEGSSLPVGGTSSHACISGHTGMASRKMLTDLTAVEKGDMFFFHVLGEDLAYQVDQIKVVLPSEDEALAIVPGEDYMTLITCTPYGVNSHRLLVRGTRVDYDFSDGDGSNSLPITRRLSTVEMVRYGIGIVSVVIVIVMLVLTIRGTIQDKRRRENKLQNAKMKAKAKLRRKGESSH